MQSIINTKLPEFKLQAFQNNEFKVVTDKNLQGKWSVLFFYPADFTFVCPTELGDIADKYEELKAINCEVYSVSTDTHFVHKAWWDTSETIKKIKFAMLADPTGALSRALGTYIEEDGVTYRCTFIVDPQGVIQVAEYSNNSVGRNRRRDCPQGSGFPVCCRKRRRSLPGQLETRCGNPQAGS